MSSRRPDRHVLHTSRLNTPAVERRHGRRGTPEQPCNVDRSQRRVLGMHRLQYDRRSPAPEGGSAVPFSPYEAISASLNNGSWTSTRAPRRLASAATRIVLDSVASFTPPRYARPRIQHRLPRQSAELRLEALDGVLGHTIVDLAPQRVSGCVDGHAGSTGRQECSDRRLRGPGRAGASRAASSKRPSRRCSSHPVARAAFASSFARAMLTSR